MIITCPCCNTRFSLDEKQLEGVINPRFHCSRCNHLFGKELFAPAPLNSLPLNSPLLNSAQTSPAAFASIEPPIQERHLQERDIQERNIQERNLQGSKNDRRFEHLGSVGPDLVYAATESMKGIGNDQQASNQPAFNQPSHAQQPAARSAAAPAQPITSRESLSATNQARGRFLTERNKRDTDLDVDMPSIPWPSSDSTYSYEVSPQSLGLMASEVKSRGLKSSEVPSFGGEALFSTPLSAAEPISIQAKSPQRKSQELELLSDENIIGKQSGLGSSLVLPFQAPLRPPTINPPALAASSHKFDSSSLAGELFTENQPTDSVSDLESFFGSASAASRHSSGSTSMAVFWSFPVLVLFALYLVGGSVLEAGQKASILIEPLARSKQSNAAHHSGNVAGTALNAGNLNEIHIEEYSSSFITLENGVKVLEIRGSAVNRGQGDISDIFLKAVLYNDRNEPVAEMTFPLDNLLNEADSISTLPEEQLTKLQQTLKSSANQGTDQGSAELAGTRALLKPGDRHSFRAVFSHVSADFRWYTVMPWID